jgi:hypothetical protein
MAAITIGYPHSSQSFFLDKFLIVTGLSLGYVAALAFAWALLEAGEARSRVVLAVAAVAAATALFLHSVVGAAVVIAGIGAAGLATLLPRGTKLAARPAVAVIAGALLASAIAFPYLKLCTVSKVDEPARLGFHLDMAWAWLAAGGFLLALTGREAVAWWRGEQGMRGERARFLLYFAGFVLLSLVVTLVNRNESKFFNLGTLLLAVPAAGGWVRLRGTRAGQLAWAVLLLGCVPTFLIGLSGFVAPGDVGVAGRVTPPPADRDIYAWIDRYTSPGSALLALPASADGELSRDPMVHARRALLWSGPEHGKNWGYAPEELSSRADVVEALARSTWSPRETETLDRLEERAIAEIDYLAPMGKKVTGPWEEVARNAMWVVYRWPAPRRLASVIR